MQGVGSVIRNWGLERTQSSFLDTNTRVGGEGVMKRRSRKKKKRLCLYSNGLYHPVIQKILPFFKKKMNRKLLRAFIIRNSPARISTVLSINGNVVFGKKCIRGAQQFLGLHSSLYC